MVAAFGADQASNIRKKTVAATEGDAIMPYESRPPDKQLIYIDTLRRELGDAQKSYDDFQNNAMRRFNERLHGRGLTGIDLPALPADPDSASSGSGAVHAMRQ